MVRPKGNGDKEQSHAAWTGVTVSQRGVDEAYLRRFDAMLAHTGRQVNKDM